MPPGSLEAYFRKWESKWIEEQKDINNPKIPLTFITEHGELVYSDQKTLDLNKAKAVRAQRTKDARNRKAAKKKAQEELKRSEEQTSELQSLMRISYTALCLKKKTKQ